MAENKPVVCRICKFAQKVRPDKAKMNPGRIWCICFRKEFNNNKRCPKGELAGATQGMMKQVAKRPHNKNAFVRTK